MYSLILPFSIRSGSAQFDTERKLRGRRDCSILSLVLVFICFALPRAVQGTALPNHNTADGQFALDSATSAAAGNTAIGFSALTDNTGGDFNTATGGFALANSNSSYNTATGYAALYNNTSGAFNTATGLNALRLNVLGSDNTATGYYALYSNTADGNTANGSSALRFNKDGLANTAEGYQALYTNQTGDYNTATGYSALRQNVANQNTAYGAYAMYGNVNANRNTAVGFRALIANQSGEDNTATGANALLNTGGSFNTAHGSGALQNTKATNNIGLGWNAGANLTTGSNNIDIGNFGVAGESSTTRLGTNQTRTFIAGIRGRTTANANAIPVLIDSAGQLGTASSSRRFKEEIKPMDQTSEAILELEPVTFQYKSDRTDTPQFGLIAEEVAKVNPDLVVLDEKGEIYTVRYDAVNAMLLNEFLKQHRRVQKLEAIAADHRKELEAKIAQQQKQIEALTAGLEKVSNALELSKAAPRKVVSNP